MPLHKGKVDLKEWLKEYALRRYGPQSEHACQGLLCLLEGPYRPGTNGTERSSILAARPALDVKKSGPNAGLGIPYPPELLIRVQSLLMADSAQLKGSDAYRFDVMDVQRQIMSNLGQVIHKKAVEAYRKGNLAEFERHSQCFLALLEDVDRKGFV